jgi:molybdopterin adenylyltransferase
MTRGPGARAAVLTVSDGVAGGSRGDESGQALADVLRAAGYDVVASVVPDEAGRIREELRRLAAEAELVVTTGGTGLGPRDVTPEATRAVLDREAPGLAEAMRAAGRASTPMADLSRGVSGVIDGALVLNLPGSPRGAMESLEAVLPVLPHALELLGGHTTHSEAPPGPRPEAAPRPAGDMVVATAVRVHGSPPCRPGQKLLLSSAGPVAGTLGCAEFDAGAASDAPGVLVSGEPAVRTYRHDLGSVEVFLDPRPRAPRLVVLGATPVALWVLRWGRDLGYDTVLVEPRPERVTAEHREVAGEVLAEPVAAALDADTDAVHTDHDAPGLAEHVAVLLGAGVRFVGVMGSRRHVGPHIERLRALGVVDPELARVRSPVGLDIGARTPQEIALSILAGLVASRTGKAGGWLDGGGR